MAGRIWRHFVDFPFLAKILQRFPWGSSGEAGQHWPLFLLSWDRTALGIPLLWLQSTALGVLLILSLGLRDSSNIWISCTSSWASGTLTFIQSLVDLCCLYVSLKFIPVQLSIRLFCSFEIRSFRVTKMTLVTVQSSVLVILKILLFSVDFLLILHLFSSTSLENTLHFLTTLPCDSCSKL